MLTFLLADSVYFDLTFRLFGFKDHAESRRVAYASVTSFRREGVRGLGFTVYGVDVQRDLPDALPGPNFFPKGRHCFLRVRYKYRGVGFPQR